MKTSTVFLSVFMSVLAVAAGVGVAGSVMGRAWVLSHLATWPVLGAAVVIAVLVAWALAARWVNGLDDAVIAKGWDRKDNL